MVLLKSKDVYKLGKFVSEGMIMGVSIEQMRGQILKVYPGDRWISRVSKMNDDQILAIYRRFLDSGKLRGGK